MKSIRLSLIVYFLLLLAVALGAVSYLSYESTRQALAEKEASSAKLRQSQYLDECKRARDGFDKDIFSRARILAGRAFFVSHQLDIPVTLGMTLANLPHTAHLQLSIWDRMGDGFDQMFRGRPLDQYADWRRKVSRPTDVRLFAHDDDQGMPDDMPADDLVDKGEYYQVSSRISGRVYDRSHTLGDATFKYDEELRKKLTQQGYFDDVQLRPGHTVRRVVWPVNPKIRLGVQASLARPVKKAPAFPGPKDGFGPGPKDGFGRGGPTVAFHFAMDTTARDKQLAELEDNLKRDLDTMHDNTRVALAGLRTRMLWIGFGTFAAIVVGGFFLVHLGLFPLKRLSDAVHQVSVKDFRLPIDQSRLPTELQPIAARMAETLEQLKRAFGREKQAAADISHELRTPLATLLTTIDVTLAKPRTPEVYRETLEDCRISGRHMNQLVERLLTLARLDAGANQLRTRAVDMTNLAQQCADMVRPLAKARGLDLRVHTNGPAVLEADPDKICEVLNNLLSNAIEYNRPNGSIDVSVGRDNGHLTLEVRDTGIGIPPEARDRIFERFFRADPSRHAEGMHAGLGLAIVKGYVDLMGGTIRVDSSPAGSTFCLNFPAG